MLFARRAKEFSQSSGLNQMRSNDFPSRAQSMLEYLILIGVVTVVLVALGPLFKRGIQAVVRLTADQLQTQANAEQKVTPTSGYLIYQYSTSQADNLKEKLEFLGDTIYNTNSQETVESNSLANLGFTNRYF